MCNIVQSPIANIVSSRSDTSSIRASHFLSRQIWTPLTVQVSGAPQPTNKTRQTRENEPFIQITTQTLDASEDNAVGLDFLRKLCLISSFGSKLSCVLWLLTVICSKAAAGLLLSDLNTFGHSEKSDFFYLHGNTSSAGCLSYKTHTIRLWRKYFYCYMYLPWPLRYNSYNKYSQV